MGRLITGCAVKLTEAGNLQPMARVSSARWNLRCPVDIKKDKKGNQKEQFHLPKEIVKAWKCIGRRGGCLHFIRWRGIPLIKM